MSQITQVDRSKPTAGGILKAHIQLGAKIANPVTYVNAFKGYHQGKGLVYSSQHRYLGPFNPIGPENTFNPATHADQRAYFHDLAYHRFTERTGKQPYKYYHKSDDELINKTHWDEPDALLAKYIFGGKKLLHEAGLIPHADEVE